MQGNGVQETCDVPIFIEDAVERHENKSQNQTVVLEMAVINEDSIGFDQYNQQKDLRHFFLELRGKKIDRREEKDEIDQKSSETHIDFECFRLVASLDAHRVRLDTLIDLAENVG